METPQWFSGHYGTLPLAVLENPQLKLRSKLVLAAISSFAGEQGCTPALSKKKIAGRAGLPATNLARELRELVEHGWLEIRHQPGANSLYQLKTPDASATASGNVKHPSRKTQATEGRLADAPVVTRPATVISVARHGNSWLVSFALEEGSRVGTIFPDCDKPCEPGDTACIKVREWRGRKGIAGGAASGIRWISHHPAPPPIEAIAFELLVSEYQRFATPAGIVFVSFVAANEMIRAVAMLPARHMPEGIVNGVMLRVSRIDGDPIRVSRTEALLEITGDSYLVELIK